MEEIPVTRAYLESLAASDLVRMADSYGIDMPPDLDRIFIIEELLDAVSDSESFSEEPALAPEHEMADSGLKESAPLPKQYNITFIEAMIRDPLWAFVFWEIRASDKEQFEKAPEFDGYYLKVSPGGGPAAEGVFTVPVKPEDCAWYLGLSPAIGNGPSREAPQKYKVELCASMKGVETVIVASSPFSLPGLPAFSTGGAPDRAAEARGDGGSPLAGLSGLRDFHVIRNSERPPRAKKGERAGSL